MKLLADDWLSFVRDAASALPEMPGVSLTMQHTVSGTPNGKVVCRAEIRDGRLVELGLGKRADAACALTWTYDEALAALRGASLDVAFMQGRLKLDGDYHGFLLELRPVFTSAEGTAFVAAVRDNTDD